MNIYDLAGLVVLQMKHRTKQIVRDSSIVTVLVFVLICTYVISTNNTPEPKPEEVKVKDIDFPADFPTGYKTIHVFVGNRTRKERPYLRKSRGQFHSQHKQDRYIIKLFRGKKRGTFIDLAANQAYSLSNTFALERDFDWNGLCVDANYNVWAELATRKCTVVAAAAGRSMDEEIPFRFRIKSESVYAGLIKDGMKMAGRSTDQGTVYTVTLNNLFEHFNLPVVIDYFSLDIEGAETYVLETFDWDKYKFNVISIEQPKSIVREKLIQYGYYYLMSLTKDELWVHSSFISKKQAHILTD